MNIQSYDSEILGEDPGRLFGNGVDTGGRRRSGSVGSSGSGAGAASSSSSLGNMVGGADDDDEDYMGPPPIPTLMGGVPAFESHLVEDLSVVRFPLRL